MAFFVPTVPSNEHIHKVVEHFGPFVPKAFKLQENISFVFLCYTNRCGSNYLAELFASGGKYNLAGEDINYNTILNHTKLHNLRSFQDYFSHLIKIKAKSGTLFLKMAPQHIELLGRAGLLEQIVRSSKFVQIERSDKLSQAISFAIAFSTGKFTSQIAGEKELSSLEFSSETITGILNGLTESYKRFDLFFARNGIVPVNVIYEQLAADPIRYMEMINKQLGMTDLHIVPERVRIEKQAGSLNQSWRQKYLASLA